MKENTKESFEKINWSSLVINTCAQSLDYILKDLDEMEMTANSASGGKYLGLTNIVEQLSYIIKSESGIIMELSD